MGKGFLASGLPELDPERKGGHQAMKVAVPLFETYVAPRFCFAHEMLVATVDEGVVLARERAALDGLGWPDRIRLLQRWGVKVVLAGGFGRHQLPMAQACGIRVIWGLRGEAEAVLAAFCSGDISDVADREDLPRKRRRQAQRRRRGRRRPGKRG